MSEATNTSSNQETELQRVYKLVDHWYGETKRLRAALERIGNPLLVYASDEDDDHDTQLSMRMADARAALSAPTRAVETPQSSNERLLRAAKALADRMPTRNLKDFHARAEVIELRQAIESCAHETSSDVVALLAVQQENKRLRGALAAIAAGTPDLLPPYRAMGATQLRDIAIKTLQGPPEKASEQQPSAPSAAGSLTTAPSREGAGAATVGAGPAEKVVEQLCNCGEFCAFAFDAVPKNGGRCRRDAAGLPTKQPVNGSEQPK